MAVMQFALGSDEDTALARSLIEELNRRGHEVTLIGPVAGQTGDWADIGRQIGQAVASGSVDHGIALCWTGTGVSIAANKIPGVRAALCWDAPTAQGARAWNDANVLALSNRATTPAVGREILEAWLAGGPDGTEAEAIAKLR